MDRINELGPKHSPEAALIDPQILQQAIFALVNNAGNLELPAGPLPVEMQKSDGTAIPLLRFQIKDRCFGADLIRFAPGKGVALHDHPGSHILIVLGGKGTLTYYDNQIDLHPGITYFVPPNVPHAIDSGDDSELTIFVVGDDHRPADSPERLELVTK